jgi:hypothetical protein
MKKYRKRSLSLVIASIISGFIAFIFFVASWEFFRVFSWGCLIFAVISFSLGVVAIVEVFRNWKKGKILAIVELLILFLAGFILLGTTLSLLSSFKLRRSIEINGAIMIRSLVDLINEHAKKNGHMPDANQWCDSLIGLPLFGSLRVTTSSFHIVGYPDIECNFAFNKKLSNLSANGLPGNVVLLFEADGALNLSGGPELMVRERAKDRYFFFRDKFIYIGFVDSTIIKYRLNDNAAAVYKRETDKFTDWLKQGQTPYSPLRWK